MAASNSTNIDPMDAAMGKAFTDNVINSMGPKTPERLREVMTALIRHVHDFAREVDLTVDEWMAGVQLMNWAGQMSNDRRNEGQLVCDVIGLESLVDALTYKKAAESGDDVTASAILGPFYRHDHPIRENGASMVLNVPEDGVMAYMHGVVTDGKTGKPIANASIDLWQASTNGLYEQQDPEQTEHNLRGRFITDSEGRYATYCLRPTPYPVPDDGPAGKLLGLMDRHPFRPGHIHLMVHAKGYKSVTTQIFDKDSKYLDDDSVFAVKNDLTVEFKERKGDEKATFELQYNISLAPEGEKGEGSAPLSTAGN